MTSFVITVAFDEALSPIESHVDWKLWNWIPNTLGKNKIGKISASHGKAE